MKKGNNSGNLWPGLTKKWRAHLHIIKACVASCIQMIWELQLRDRTFHTQKKPTYPLLTPVYPNLISLDGSLMRTRSVRQNHKRINPPVPHYLLTALKYFGPGIPFSRSSLTEMWTKPLQCSPSSHCLFTGNFKLLIAYLQVISNFSLPIYR